MIAPGPQDEALRALAEAAAWRVALCADGADTDGTASDEFQVWLRAGPNAAAWRQVQANWDYFGDHAIAPEMIQLRRDALGRANRARAARHQAPRQWALGRRQILPRAVAAGVLLVLAGLGAGVPWHGAPAETYRTGFGERRMVNLADGSRIALDSGTTLTVRLERHARRLWLLDGQARFDVAHDATRPFTVRAGGHIVTATGTSFNVDLIGGRLMVTLMQGSVVVAGAPADSGMGWLRANDAPIEGRLLPGQRLVAARGVSALPVLVETTTVEDATAWQDGELIFRRETLEHAAERVSRYSKQQVVADESARAITLSGVFATGDISHFIDAVQGALPVRAITGRDGAVHLMRRGKDMKG